MVGNYVLSESAREAYLGSAVAVRRALVAEFEAVWASGVSAMLTPTCPTGPFPVAGAADADPLGMYVNDVMTVASNLTGTLQWLGRVVNAKRPWRVCLTRCWLLQAPRRSACLSRCPHMMREQRQRCRCHCKSLASTETRRPCANLPKCLKLERRSPTTCRRVCCRARHKRCLLKNVPGASLAC